MTGFVDTLEQFMELEDKAIHDYVIKHNAFLKKIEVYEVHFENDLSLGQVELARMEYWYSKAQLYAYLIAGHYRGKQKSLEGQAEQAQADMYENVRLKIYDPLLSSATDAQYLSRRAKGKKLEEAAPHEKGYTKWMGVAKSYESAINTVKDMIKGGKADERGKVFE